MFYLNTYCNIVDTVVRYTNGHSTLYQQSKNQFVYPFSLVLHATRSCDLCIKNRQKENSQNRLSVIPQNWFSIFMQTISRQSVVNSILHKRHGNFQSAFLVWGKTERYEGQLQNCCCQFYIIVNIGSDSGPSPIRCRTAVGTSVDPLTIGPCWVVLHGIWIKVS